MDCNFPEMLVHDLEASKSVFSAKNMTAGAPSVLSMSAVQSLLPADSDLHLIDGSIAVRLEEDYTPAPSPGIRYCPARQSRLEPIDEAPADGAIGGAVNESDWDSLSSSSHPSSILESPSAWRRDASVATTATSLASGPGPTLARKGSVDLAAVSWIDADSDSEEFPAAQSVLSKPVPPLKRRQGFIAEPEAVPNRGPDADVGGAPAGPAFARPLRDSYPCHSGRVSKRWAVRRRGTIRIIAGQGFSLDALSLQESEILPVPALPARAPSPILAPRQNGVSPDVLAADEATETKADFPPPSPIQSTPRPDDGPTAEARSTKPSADANREAMPSIQSWLNSSHEPSKPDEPPGIPLPPDVVENLRTSIACFPDTMLLTSSLSVETIRSYSRKVKTFPTETPAQAAGYMGRRWRISRILSSRRSNASSGGRAPRDEGEVPAPVAPWGAIRGVFDGGSEFLCDALYAHILAYNYVSTLRSRPAAPKSVSVSTKKDDDVPRKAAALLGLRTEPAAEGTERPSGETLRGPSDRRDGALRDLVVGLLRCISRLVATLREGGTEVLEEAVGEVDGKGDGDGDGDVDVLLLRALCEIVRCSEER